MHVALKQGIALQCRPPGIYKGGYLRELWERFGVGAEDAPNAPGLPEWCFEDEDAGNNDDDDDGDDYDIQQNKDGHDRKRSYDTNERPVKRRRKEHHVKVGFAI